MNESLNEPIQRDPELSELLGGGTASSEASCEVPSDLLNELRSGVTKGIAAEDARPLAGLRHRPAWQRNLVGALALALLVVATYFAAPRPDLEHYPMGRLGLEVGAYGAVFLLSLLAATRGAHLPSLPRSLTWTLAIVSIAAVLVVGALPEPHGQDSYAPRGIMELLSPCALIGVMVGLPVYALLRFLDRGSPLSAIAAACAAGLAGNSFLQMHCSVTDHTHLMTGHGMVGVWIIGGVWLVKRSEERRRSEARAGSQA